MRAVMVSLCKGLTVLISRPSQLMLFSLCLKDSSKKQLEGKHLTTKSTAEKHVTFERKPKRRGSGICSLM
jgi:hypothetical protein